MRVRNVGTSGTKGVGFGMRRVGVCILCRARHCWQVKVLDEDGRASRVDGRLNAILKYADDSTNW